MKGLRLLWLCGCLLPAWGLAEQLVYIDAIQFVGNRVTEERILRQEMLLVPGDELDLQRLEESRQAIMNLGLFRQVWADALQEEGQTLIEIRVEERFYLLPLPLLGMKPESEEVSYGMELRYDNLFGLNQRLKLSFEHKTSLDDEDRLLREWELDYRYPRVFGGRNNFSMRTRLRSQEVVLEEAGEETGGYQRDQFVFSIGLSRWLGAQRSSDGWRLGGGLNLIRNEYTDQWGSVLGDVSQQAVDISVDIGYHRVAEHPYHRDGQSYGYSVWYAVPELGSDFTYLRHLLYWRKYRPLNRVDANLDSQLRFGLASGSSFGSAAWSVGGSGLRGYQDGIGPGNAMMQLNLEYHHRITGHRQLRAVLFSDIGNTWEDAGAIEMRGFHHSLGVGMRWRVQRFVDTTLRIDYGYGLRTGERRAYFGTSATF